jgi:hypothetical protein
MITRTKQPTYIFDLILGVSLLGQVFDIHENNYKPKPVLAGKPKYGTDHKGRCVVIGYSDD